MQDLGYLQQPGSVAVDQGPHIREFIGMPSCWRYRMTVATNSPTLASPSPSGTTLISMIATLTPGGVGF